MIAVNNPPIHTTCLKIVGVALVVFLIGTAGVCADATNRLAVQVGGPAPAIDAGTSVLRMMGSLAIVIAILFGGVWLWKRSQTWQRGGRAARLQVVETRSLGPRQSLAVVGYERQRFLISCTPAGVTMLTALPDETTVVAMPVETPADSKPPLPSFAQALATAWGRR